MIYIQKGRYEIIYVSFTKILSYYNSCLIFFFIFNYFSLKFSLVLTYLYQSYNLLRENFQPSSFFHPYSRDTTFPQCFLDSCSTIFTNTVNVNWRVNRNIRVSSQLLLSTNLHFFQFHSFTPLLSFITIIAFSTLVKSHAHREYLTQFSLEMKMYLLKFKRKYTTLNGTEISKRRSSIKNDPRKDPRIDEGKIEGKKKNSETEAEWNKREFPFLGLGFSRWEAKQLKSLARVNLVQLSPGCRWKERERFAVILRRFAMSSSPPRINAANHAAII